jgi:hypothetical protein
VHFVKLRGLSHPTHLYAWRFPKMMTAPEVLALKTDLKPGTVKAWGEWARSQVTSDTPKFEEYLDLPEDEYMIAIQNDLELQVEDKRNAKVLGAVLNSTSTHVKNFKSDIAKLDENAREAGLGLDPITDRGKRGPRS